MRMRMRTLNSPPVCLEVAILSGKDLVIRDPTFSSLTAFIEAAMCLESIEPDTTRKGNNMEATSLGASQPRKKTRPESTHNFF